MWRYFLLVFRVLILILTIFESTLIHSIPQFKSVRIHAESDEQPPVYSLLSLWVSGRLIHCALLFGKCVCHISNSSLADGDVCARTRCGSVIIKTQVTIYLIKQQFIVTHRYTTLHETEVNWQIAKRPTLKCVVFLHIYKDKQFSRQHNILNVG